jgi:hypothetical protein
MRCVFRSPALMEWKLFDIDGNVTACHLVQTAWRIQTGYPGVNSQSDVEYS